MPLQHTSPVHRRTLTTLAVFALLGGLGTPFLAAADDDGPPDDGGPDDGGDPGPGLGATPFFTAPLHPRCGTTIPATAGKTLTFDVDAHDPDKEDLVTLDATGLPADATFPGSTGNPAQATFTWTLPDQHHGQTVLTFRAEDSNLNQATCTITVNAALPVGVGLRNPGFEPSTRASSSSCSLNDWTQGTIADSATAITTDTTPTPSVVPPYGSCMARLGTSTATSAATQPAGTTELSQEFIASNTAKVAFQTNVYSYDASGTDQAGWEILNAKNEVVASHWTKTWGPSGDTTLKSTGWQTWTPNLALHEGQLLRLRFALVNGNEANPTWMYIDGVPDANDPPEPWVKPGLPVEDPRTSSSSILGPYTYSFAADGTLVVALSNPAMAAAPTSLEFGAHVTCPDGNPPTGVRLLLNDLAAQDSMIRPLADLPTWWTTVHGFPIFSWIYPQHVVAGQLRLSVACGVTYLVPVGTVVPYDPLGTLRDRTDCTDPAVPATCKPIPDATVMLYLAPCNFQFKVPIPANRVQPPINPLRTNARGEFGWTSFPTTTCPYLEANAEGYEFKDLRGAVGQPFGDLLLTPTAEALKQRTGLVHLTIPGMPMPNQAKGTFSQGHVETIRLRFAKDTGEILGTCDAIRGQVTCDGDVIAHNGMIVQLPAGKLTLSVIPGPHGIQDRWKHSTQSLTVQHAKTTKATINAATDDYILRLHGDRPGDLRVSTRVATTLLSFHCDITDAQAPACLAGARITTDGQHIFLPPDQLPSKPKVRVTLSPQGAIADKYLLGIVDLSPRPNQPAAVPIRMPLASDGILKAKANGQGLGAYTVAFGDGSMCTFQPGGNPDCTGNAFGLPGNKVVLAPGKHSWKAEATGSFKTLQGHITVQGRREIPLALAFRPAQDPQVELPQDVLAKLGMATVTITSDADGTLGTCVVSTQGTTCDTAGKLTSQAPRFITLGDGTGPFTVTIASEAYKPATATVSGKKPVEQVRPTLVLKEPMLVIEVRPAHLSDFFFTAGSTSIHHITGYHCKPQWGACYLLAGGTFTLTTIPFVVVGDGKFSLNPAEGPYGVQARAPGYRELHFSDVKAEPGKVTRLVLDFKPL